MNVAFQGEIGAFSEQAVRAFFSDGVELLPCALFEDVFSAVELGTAGSGLIPIENSLFGSVHTNYDLLRRHSLQISGEIKLRIVHNLMSLDGQSIGDIRAVYSHPQALGQCQDFLRDQLPDAQIVPAYDTAGAAKMVMEKRQPGTAAIASEAAADVYGLKILARGIESDHQNYTRFLVLTREGTAKLPNGGNEYKTSVVYAMNRNVPGALFKSLAVFALRDLDLYKIESRPLVGSPWAYLFYLDFQGHESDEPVQRALDHLAELTAYLKVLGSYPRGRVID